MSFYSQRIITFSFINLGIPNAMLITEPNTGSVCFGKETKIDSTIETCPPLEGALWQKSSDLVTFEEMDMKNPKYFGSTSDIANPVLKFAKPTFSDRLYYRLQVWNKIGESYSNTVYLNVTGGMCLSI
jgi:hypothetical protein